MVLGSSHIHINILRFLKYGCILNLALHVFVENTAEAVLRKHLKTNEDRTVALSAVTQSNLRDLIRTVGFRRVSYVGPVANAQHRFDEFQWGGRSEDAGTPDARNHIEVQFLKFGVTIGVGGFKVVDVHKNSTLLNVEEEKTGNISGGSDVVLLPFKTLQDVGGVGRAHDGREG